MQAELLLHPSGWSGVWVVLLRRKGLLLLVFALRFPQQGLHGGVVRVDMSLPRGRSSPPARARGDACPPQWWLGSGMGEASGSGLGPGGLTRCSCPG